MLVNIKLPEPSKANAVIRAFLSIINKDKELKQQIINSGILLEDLQSNEVSSLKERLDELKYTTYLASGNFIHLYSVDDTVTRLFDILIRLLLPDNKLKRMQHWPKIISTRGITFTGISAEKTDKLKKHLEPESAIVTITEADFDDNKPVPDNGDRHFMVSGTVEDSDARPLGDLVVKAFDKDMRSEEFLGETKTDRSGNYLIIYYAHQFRRAEKGSADLIIRVFDNKGKILVSSDVVFNAPREALINLQVTSPIKQGPSEWEMYHQIIKPLREKIEVHDLTDDDLDFLSREAEISLLFLEYLRLDAQWCLKYKIPQAVFYGLLRQDMPPELNLLLSFKPSEKRDAIKISLDDHLIPGSIEKKLDEIILQLTNLALQVSFEPPVDSTFTQPPLGLLLAGTGLPDDLQKKITGFVLTYEGEENIWDALAGQEGIDDRVLQELKFVTDINLMFSGHYPTLGLIQKYKQNNSLNDVRDLAGISLDGWNNLLVDLDEKDIPDGFNNKEEYAVALTGIIEHAFPTATITNHLKTDSEFGTADLNYFLASNPGFDFLHTPVEIFFANGADTGQINDVEAVKQQLKKLQRVAQLAPGKGRYDVMRGLLHAGYDSAWKIMNSDQELVFQNIVQISGPAVATEVLQNAQFRNLGSQILHQGIRDFWIDRPWVIPDLFPGRGEPFSELPDWVGLFGTLGNCRCEHCRSVHSPAAYLTDLLQFLKRAPRAAGGQRIDQVFRQRRPDIEHLLLNCDNANTPIPYIDLINETLERLVTGTESGPYYQTEGSTALDRARLRALPANENMAAYTTLADQRHPWTLPFQIHFQKVMLWASHHKFDLTDLRTLLGASPEEQARLTLSINEPAWNLITVAAADSAELAANWGLSSLAAWEDDIPSVLKRIGLTYQEFETVLTSQFFQEYELGIDVSADPCDYLQHRFSRPADEILDRMHRFIRLRHLLGWKVQRIDNVFSNLGITETDSEAMINLSRVIRLTDKYSLDLLRFSALVNLDPVDLFKDLARLLRADVRALRTFQRIAGIDFSASNRIDTLEQFLFFWSLLQSTTTDVFELAWILRHEDLTPATFHAPEDTLLNHLEALHQGVIELRNDTLTSTESRIGEILQQTLASLPEGTSASATETALQEAREAELLLIEAELEQQISDLIIEYHAAFLGTDTGIIDALIRPLETGEDDEVYPSVLHSVSDENEPAINDWIDFVNAEEPDEDLVSRSVEWLIRLDKCVRLVRLLQLNPGELRTIAIMPDPAGFLNFNDLIAEPSAEPSFESWANLARARLLQEQLPKADTHIFDWVEMALSGDFSREEMLEELAAATGWNTDLRSGEEQDNTESLFEAVYPGGDVSLLGQISTLEKIFQGVKYIRRWGTSAANIISIARDPLLSLPTSLMELSRQQFDSDTSWYESIIPLMDGFRESKRDALLAYLLNRRDDDGNLLWEDTNDLYARLLLDVEMSACQLSSRIVQATNSIQMFVQRVLMGLESEAILGSETDSVHWKQWMWMKNYRVWEANRKVFLFPENWIEPDLRTDNSPFFKELTQELLQGEINHENISRAYENYFTKLDEVSRLDIRCLFEESTGDMGGKIIHVIGRTFNEPRIYYYRKRLPDRRWTSWERIDIGIEGDHLAITVLFGRLMIFWLNFTEVQVGSTISNEPIKNWDINLVWSEFKNNTWQAPRKNDIAIRYDSIPKRNFSFRLGQHNDQPAMFIFIQHSINQRESGTRYRLSFGFRFANGFLFDWCDGELKISPLDSLSYLLHPLQTNAKAMKFISNPSIGQSLAVNSSSLNNNFKIIDPDEENNLIRLLRHGNLLEKFIAMIALAAQGVMQIKNLQERSLLLLRSAPIPFKLAVSNQFPQFKAFQPFFLEAEKQTWFASQRSELELIEITPPPSGFGNTGSLFNGLDFGNRNFYGTIIPEVARYAMRIRNSYEFETHYHPFFCEMFERFQKHGIEGLLKAPQRAFRLHRQLYKEWQTYTEDGRLLPFPRLTRFNTFGPTEWVWRNPDDAVNPYPYEQYDFSIDGAYSVYNWELFFHIPLLVADRLSKNQRFEDAQKWFHYIFDPTDFSAYSSPAKYWQIKPFFELARQWEGPAETLHEMMLRLNAGSEELEKQVTAWRNDPFNPHLLANMRLVAYMKTVVMKYLDNLMDWGDHLFRQDTMESINEATQLFVLAAQILGKRPVMVNRPQTSDLSYYQIQGQLDSFSNVLVEIESYLPPATATGSSELPVNLMLYFCIPSNAKLLGYWDTLDDRLFKIRNCMNIEGQVRQLPLFAPPIDPALLVRARAMGLDLGEAVSNLVNPGLPHYRYRILADKAMAFCNDVRALGSSLLSALEKKDNAELTLLRSRMEIALLDQASELNNLRIEEAKLNLEGLKVSLDQSLHNLEYYSSKDLMNVYEILEIASVGTAFLSTIISKIFSKASSTSHNIPDTKVGAPTTAGATTGGSNIGSSFKMEATVFDIIAKSSDYLAKGFALMGKADQRMDGWKQQAKLAAFEIKRIEKQILAAEIRMDAADREKQLQEQRLRDARELENFHKSRFTGAELFGWMSGNVSSLYFQAYRMAVDLARKAETAAQFELGINASEFSYIDFGHWDSQRKGLLAGERLQQNLRRMDAAYLDKNKREYELSKKISIPDLDPLAFIALRETGQCVITIPEVLYDIDHPGHFFRRLKTVNLTINCNAGDHTTVACKLTLLNSHTRINASRISPYPMDTDDEDDRFVSRFAAVHSIATSHGQKDTGMFEMNFRDERYLPFEGSGAISTWRLELSGKWDDVELPQFDFESISDVVLDIKYTARDGGARLKSAAVNNLQNALNELVSISDQGGLLRMISLANEQSIQWQNFIGSPSQSLNGISINRDHFPFLARSKGITIQNLLAFVSGQSDPLPQHALQLSGNDSSGWNLNINFPPDVNPAEVNDVFVVCHYVIS